MPRLPRSPEADGRQSRWDDHNAERRILVLEAAVALIEQLPSGSEIHVQQIAEKAGLIRTVVYRHFNGRADLNRAVQAHIVSKARDAVASGVVLSGTTVEMIQRIVGSYVDWVAEHPTLHEVAERALGDGLPGELDLAIRSATDRFSTLIRTGAKLLGITLDDAQTAALDLLVVGLIGQVRGTVGLWIRRPERLPSERELTTLLSQWIWFQIDGQAKALGVALDPTVSLEQLAESRTRTRSQGTTPRPR
jgi:AcrR family transcriptional regulator